jgi:hypothetical protein
MWSPFFTGNTCQDVLYDGAPIDAAAMIRLCNFATGSDRVLDSHLLWLSTLTRTAVATANSWVDIVGYASQLPYRPGDTSGGNWTLSQRRCAAVQREMEHILTDLRTNRGFTINVRMGVGDSQSSMDSTRNHDHGFFRAVVVKFFAPPQKWSMPPELRHGITTVDATQFEFEPVEIAGAGLSRAQADWLYFGIHDLNNGRRRYFAHIGGSGTPPVSFAPAVSFYAEHAGRTVPFTSRPWGVADLEDFEGPSTLYQAIGATVGTHSIGGAMRLQWSPKAWRDHGYSQNLEVPFSFSSGFGISAGAVGPGYVKIMDPSFKPTIYSR